LSKDFGNWCPDIYKNIYIERRGIDSIAIAPCCAAKTKDFPVNEFDYHTNPYLKSIRKQADDQVRSESCARCWKEEDAGSSSRRLSALPLYDQVDTTVSLVNIDFNATWACNLACIMCGPDSSSTWAAELKYKSKDLENIGKKLYNQNKIADRLDFSSLQKIYFNGGEPLLNDEHIEVLSKIAEQGRLSEVYVLYSTNGTFYPSVETINLWKQTKCVRLYLSIDAIGAAFNYVRYHAHWEQVSDNINRMRNEIPELMFGVNITIGAYNVLEVIDVWNWFNDTISTNKNGDMSDFRWQYAENFSPSNLSAEVKQAAIKSMEDVPELANIVTYLKSSLDKTQNDSWISKLEMIDQRRGTNWKTALKIATYY
jgi:organic radical activating enzyme